MKRLSIFLFIYMFAGISAWALDVEEFLATSIDVSQGEVTFYSHESILLGLSCKSGPAEDGGRSCRTCLTETMIATKMVSCPDQHA